LRIPTRVLVSVLLFMSVLPVLLAPAVSSQVVTTTSFRSIVSDTTSQFTTTLTDVPISFTVKPSDYNESSGRLSLAKGYHCGVFKFYASKGQRVYGTVETSDWVAFYLQNHTYSPMLLQARGESFYWCRTPSTPREYILKRTVKDKWSFDTVLPADDNYTIWFHNREKDVTVHFHALTSLVTTGMMTLHHSITVTSLGFSTPVLVQTSSSTRPAVPPVTISDQWLLLVVIVLTTVVLILSLTRRTKFGKAKATQSEASNN
jgi:hypothetical protein